MERNCVFRVCLTLALASPVSFGSPFFLTAGEKLDYPSRFLAFSALAPTDDDEHLVIRNLTAGASPGRISSVTVG